MICNLCGLEYKSKAESDAHYFGHLEERMSIQRVINAIILKHFDTEGNYIEKKRR